MISRDSTEPNRSLDPPLLSPLVVVIILNWNGRSDTLSCLRSLQQSSYKNHRIIVVDNGSEDDSVSWLRQTFPDLELLETGKNLGFAAGNNFGMHYAIKTYNPEYLWLLNNDTLVDAKAMEALLTAAEDNPETGVLGSVLVEANRPDLVQEWGGKRIGLLSGVPWPASAKRPPNYICGASLFLRRACLEQTGLFDPGFFFFFEDADLSFRIRKMGWDMKVVENSQVRHKGAASSGPGTYFQSYHYRLGLIRFMRAHALLPWLPILLSTAARLLIAAMTRQGHVFRGTMRGAMDGLLKKEGP
jgi:GT2 family glycosyltransferase